MNLKKMGKEELQKEALKVLEKMTKPQLIKLIETKGLKNLNLIVKNKNQNEIAINEIELIDDSGMIKRHSNGGRFRSLIFKYKDKYWKLSILSESYVFQSYIKLSSSSTLDNWNLIKCGNPKKDYDIDIAYSERYTPDVYQKIIYDYKKLILKF